MRAEVGERDRADTDRASSPLRPAADAHVIDTAAMDVPTMIAHALAVCHEAGLDPVRDALMYRFLRGVMRVLVARRPPRARARRGPGQRAPRAAARCSSATTSAPSTRR